MGTLAHTSLPPPSVPSRVAPHPSTKPTSLLHRVRAPPAAGPGRGGLRRRPHCTGAWPAVLARPLQRDVISATPPPPAPPHFTAPAPGALCCTIPRRMWR